MSSPKTSVIVSAIDGSTLSTRKLQNLIKTLESEISVLQEKPCIIDLQRMHVLKRRIEDEIDVMELESQEVADYVQLVGEKKRIRKIH